MELLEGNVQCAYRALELIRAGKKIWEFVSYDYGGKKVREIYIFSQKNMDILPYVLRNLYQDSNLSSCDF